MPIDRAPSRATARFLFLRALGAALALGAAGAVHAAMQDEIQVYDDDINAPGEFGLEVHLNSTPSSRVGPAFPGEVTTLHGVRATAEFSYGITPSFDIGLYVPTVYDSGGRYRLAGLKLRAKWLPLRPDAADGGWFAGGNLELARVKRVYDEATTNAELKFIGGHRSGDWLVAGNLNFGFALGGVGAGSRPDLEVAVKAVRHVGHGVWPGLEVYADTGPVGRHLPSAQLDRRVYAVVDFERRGWGFNVGIGRGLTSASDRWTLKTVIDVPLGE